MSTEINFIKFEGKAIEKLIDVIAKGIGKIYKPTAIIKEADATAYKITAIENAKSNAKIKNQEKEQILLDRIQERNIHREILKQKNLDAINFIAAQELQHEDSVAKEPVNEDWINRFFSIVEDISDEEMQKLWGRILAGEVKKPRSYSFRTLELLKSLTHDEAAVFVKLSKYAFQAQREVFILNPDKTEYLKKVISYNDRLVMEEAGIITANNLSYNFFPGSPMKEAFTIGDTAVIVEREADAPKQGLKVLVFTRSGTELLKLVSFTPEQDYLKVFASLLKHEKVKVKQAKLISRIDNQVLFELPSIDIKTE